MNSALFSNKAFKSGGVINVVTDSAFSMNGTSLNDNTAQTGSVINVLGGSEVRITKQRFII